jgi:hypothetical protein
MLVTCLQLKQGVRRTNGTHNPFASLLPVIAIVAAVTCQRHPPVNSPAIASDFRAFVFPDSAVFVLPVSPRRVWEWNAPDTSQLGRAQYSLSVTWELPESWAYHGEGIGFRLMEPVSPRRRTGTLKQLIMAGFGVYLFPAREVSGWNVSRESSLSGTVRNNSVVLTLRRSETLRRLFQRHPTKVIVHIRMPQDQEVYERMIPVEYR